MKIQYCSDLHLEFDQNNRFLRFKPLKPCAEVLILAGDIVPLHEKYYSDPFFRFVSDHYEQVFWIPGNHEYYSRSVSDYRSSFNISFLGNINLVNNIKLNHKGIDFIFSTLWSEIGKTNEKKIEQSVSDFHCITENNELLTIAGFNRLHQAGLSFLKQSLKGKNDKTVVVTHHLPSALCNAPQHAKSPINEAFCVDLTEMIETCNANFWIYGHSHFNQKPLIIGNTMLLTNQLGYVHLNEQEGFKNNAFFAI